jgi:hypothetical protein
MLNDYYSLDFLGKNCKNNCHNICAGQWKGFGFKVDCNCECHDKKIVLGKDEVLPNTLNSPLKGNGEYGYY